MLSVFPLEEVVAAVGPVWFQIAMLRRRELIRDLVAREAAAGCPALVVTTKMPVPSRLTRSVRNRLYAIPPALTPQTLIDYGLHRSWAWRTLTGVALGSAISPARSRPPLSSPR